MPPLYRIFEVILYSLFGFLPYVFIAVYPFYKQLRFSTHITCISLTIAIVLRCISDLLWAFSPTYGWIFIFIKTLVFVIFYFIIFDVYIGKLLFTGLMILNIENLVETSAKCIGNTIFGFDKANVSFGFSYTAVMVSLEAICIIPLYFYFKAYFGKVFKKDGARVLWHYLWLVPACFDLIWYFHIYVSCGRIFPNIVPFKQALFLLMINLSAMIFYHFVSIFIDETDKNERLTESNYQLVMQKLQYESLKDRINEARQAKHDIRHHITVMDGYLQRGEYFKLHDYFKKYNHSLPDDTVITFCSNPAINTLLLFFAQQAKNDGIDFDVSVSFPDPLDIPEDMLSVVFGNLLENAVQAASASGIEVPKIIIRGKVEGDALFVKIKNSYSGEINLDKNGFYLSTKREGRGIGIESVKNIIRRRDGMIDITQENGMFCVSALLKLGHTEGK